MVTVEVVEDTTNLKEAVIINKKETQTGDTLIVVLLQSLKVTVQTWMGIILIARIKNNIISMLQPPR